MQRLDEATARDESSASVLRTIGKAILSPLIQYRRRLVWEVDLTKVQPLSQWESGQSLIVLGPENVKHDTTAELRHFLGGDAAAAELDGVGGGDRLFVVASPTEYLAYSYIFFATREASRRQARILGEAENTPIIGQSFTAREARGRGIYRRVLNEMFIYLRGTGYERAVCEVDPLNRPSIRASRAAGMRMCRELDDWRILKRILLQRVQESGRTRWRLCWVP